MTSRYYCATAARHRDDPLIGTASPARRWLLVEYAGPWAPHALDSQGLAGRVGDALHQTAMETGSRVVLVRRPGRRTVLAEQAWAVVDAGGAQHWGRWSRSEELLPAADLLRSGLATARADSTDPPDSPVLLVCTHGLHDVCCAVRGRPVAAALAAQWPEQTWECSHIGGDRFAANVLVVPDGTCYGRLDAVSAPRVVLAHLDGRIDLEHLRGFSTEPPVVQVAMAAALESPGSAVRGDLRLHSVAASGTGQWRGRLRRGPERPDVEVTVQRTTRPPAQLTCSADGDSAAYEWTVVALRELGPDAG